MILHSDDGVWNCGFALFDLHSLFIKVKTALNSYPICFLDSSDLFSIDITVMKKNYNIILIKMYANVDTFIMLLFS